MKILQTTAGAKGGTAATAAAVLFAGFLLQAPIQLRKPGPAFPQVAAHAALLLVSTNANGQTTVRYPEGKFSSAPGLAVTAQFNEGTEGHMARVTVDLNTSESFSITIRNGSGMPVVGSVQLSYVAIQ